MPSCKDCPSFIGEYDTARQEATFGTATGADVCPRKSLVLGLPSMPHTDRDARQALIASSCDVYGKPETTRVNQMLTVGIGTQDEGPGETPKISTCRSCYFYLETKAAAKVTGLNMGMCAKFATLLPPTRVTSIGKNCRAAARYTPDADPMVPAEAAREEHVARLLSGITFDPNLAQYIGNVGESETEGVQHSTSTLGTDPTEYATDREVTADHERMGIRAWRSLERGGKTVYLPIFRRDFFDVNEQKKIPNTGDDEHPEQYMDHMGLAFTVSVLWRELDETPALHGIAGTGKTEFFRYMAWLMQLPFERVSITASTELDDLAGMMTYEEGVGTKFTKGRVPLAWAKACVMVLDEPNVGPPNVWQFIRPMTDSSKQLVLDTNAGEVIGRHPHSYLGMAMNPAWDARNIGAEVLSDADGSRLMHISVDLPTAAVERDILIERCKVDNYDLPKWLLDRIMLIGKDLRELSDAGTLPVTWGIRPQIKVARATNWFDLRSAYRLAAGDYLEPSVRDMILDIVQNHHR